MLCGWLLLYEVHLGGTFVKLKLSEIYALGMHMCKLKSPHINWMRFIFIRDACPKDELAWNKSAMKFYCIQCNALFIQFFLLPFCLHPIALYVKHFAICRYFDYFTKSSGNMSLLWIFNVDVTKMKSLLYIYSSFHNYIL